MSSQATTQPSRPGLTSGQWWVRSDDGQLALWQFPNPALWVWLSTVVVGLFELSREHATRIADIGDGALIVWSIDEIIRGASPIRRVLGSIVLIGQLVSLILG